MGIDNRIFNPKLIKYEVDKLEIKDIPNYKKCLDKLGKWKYSIENSDITKTKEKQLQGRFLIDFFISVLGYKDKIGRNQWNFIQEEKTILDGSTPDGVLGYYTSSVKDTRVVIELKDAITDLDKKQKSRDNKVTPVDQAFSYAPKFGNKCNWIIVSNFKTIRLYRESNQLNYELFHICKLYDEEEFKRFYLLLNCKNLISLVGNSYVDDLYEKNKNTQLYITNKFYDDYKRIRINLFKGIKAENLSIDDLILFEKAQKLMDRFIFICFCEDTRLLKENTFKNVLQVANLSYDISNNKIWKQLKGLFNSIDKGNPAMDINRFNGGLFVIDNILDNLNIPDYIFEGLEQLSIYDFGTDLNVNILGHIFEQSISDIEDLKKEIQGIDISKDKGKRKRDGIFYTPDYVTNYIVEQTIGKWLEEKREMLGEHLLPEIPFPKPKKKTIKYTNIINKHIDFYNNYNDVLVNITAIDYACGSGAFLNAAFDYLYKEGQRVNNILTELRDGQITLFDLDKRILKNNLYGIDINAESVEITKLSLWLKTANKHDPLTTLDENIICANSLIENEEVAGSKAIYWKNSFQKVFDNGGFDIVIGNPPYGASLTEEEKRYLDVAYKTTQYNYDTYKFFIELAFKISKRGSYIGLITPNTYFILEKSNILREFLFDNYQLINLVELYNVFPDAIVEPIISIYKKQQPFINDSFEVVSIPRKAKLDNNFLQIGVTTKFKNSYLKSREGYLFNYHETKIEKDICSKILKISKSLSEYMYVTTGVKPYQTNKGNPKQTKEIVKEKPYNGYTKIDDIWLPYMRGENIDKYLDKWSGEYIKYGEWLAEPRKSKMFKNPKIFIRQTSDTLIANIDLSEKVCKNTLHCIYNKEEYKDLDLKYILALINSKLMNWIFQHDNFHIVGKPLAETKVTYVNRLPIIIGAGTDYQKIIDYANVLLDLSQEKYKLQYDFSEYMKSMYSPKKITDKLFSFNLLEFGEFIEELKKQKSKLDEKKKFELMPLFKEQKDKINNLQDKIKITYSELDYLIYNVYNLSDEEIKHIENNEYKTITYIIDKIFC